MMFKFLLRAALAASAFALATSSRTPAASTLYLSETDTTFSLNLASDSNNLYFHLQSPAKAWVGIGAGSEMKGALMFIVYASANRKDVTLSPRISTGTSEPTYTKDIRFELLTGSGIQDGDFLVNAVCYNCCSWNGGSLDVNSTSQPWMYAFGPKGNPLASDDLAAGLSQHGSYGKFTMNMIQATGVAGIPSSTTHMSGVELVGHQFVADGDHVALTHGYAMAALVLVFTPFLMLHLLSKTRLISVTYALFTIVVLLGYVTGIWDSLNYNRSKDFNTAHQVIGFAALFLLLVIALSQCIPGRMVRNDLQCKGISMTRILVAVGALTWVLALVNGFLGIKLADARKYIYIIYGCCIIAMVVIVGPLHVVMLRIARRRSTEKSLRANSAQMNEG